MGEPRYESAREFAESLARYPAPLDRAKCENLAHAFLTREAKGCADTEARTVERVAAWLDREQMRVSGRREGVLSSRAADLRSGRWEQDGE